jgi:hypothetical protein
MHAVLIEVDVTGVDPDVGIKTLREQIVPAISDMPGFKSGTWLPGNDDGRGLSFTVWDSVDHAKGMADAFGPGSSPAAGASVVRCEVREIVATA